MNKKSENKRIGIVSLGCPKNRVDSEVILGMLAKNGFEIRNADQSCDAVIVNTCSFIEDSKKEAVQEILEALELKNKNPGIKIYATGCLPQRYPIELGRELSELDGVYGVNEMEKLVKDITLTFSPNGSYPGPKMGIDMASDELWLYDHYTPRLQTTPSHYSYVKISEGCNHKCAFCTIPSIRGLYRSREISSIVTEIDNLASAGVKEINLISQDTTAFGRDKGTNILTLLKSIETLKHDIWIRLLYLHPEKVNDDLLRAIRDSDKIVNYLDIPLQHANGRVLYSMRRASMERDYLKMIREIREFFGEDNVCLRTNLIVGFPGETESEFEDLAGFVEEAQLDRLYIFKYSREPGTEAHDMPDQVDDYEIESRYNILMNIQADVSYSRNTRQVGREFRVLMEGIDDDGKCYGRSFRDAPEIDGLIYLDTEAEQGSFVDVVITEAMDYDLKGRCI